MIKMLIWLLFVAFTFSPLSAHCENYKGEDLFKQAMQLDNQKNYTSAFSLLKKGCEEDGHILSCAFLTIYYGKGIGTNQNLDEANRLLKLLLLSDNEFARLQAGLLYEYQFVDGNENLNMALEIYQSLVNSKRQDVQSELASVQRRIPIYQFLNDYNSFYKAYRTKRINFDTFYREIHRINTDNIPPNLRDIFFTYRRNCSDAFKNDEDTLWHMAKSAGSTFVKTLLGGWVGFGESMLEATQKDSERADTANMCSKWTNLFEEEVSKEGISNLWLLQSLR